MVHESSLKNSKVGMRAELADCTREEISFSTYNRMRGLTRKQRAFMRRRVTLREFSFIQPKMRRTMTMDDPNVRAICEERHQFRFNFIFGGKVSSGTPDIFEFIAEHCKDALHTFWLLLCPHELEEKREHLIALGFLESQFIVFTDDYFKRGEQCNEFLAFLELFGM